ncbi:galactose oxidase early set domain-containing protein [Streptomyces cucumeris]|uniref:galactose oxidase early set domain-containing protein n=1 Tax=Streptomyces cucumeris TaxID=2962890 RepID=UPI003D763E38
MRSRRALHLTRALRRCSHLLIALGVGSALVGLTPLLGVASPAATHSTDNDQRRVPLVSTPGGSGRYQVSIPADPGVAIPGTYMLFALDADGVPSMARFLTIA